ncbi:MAG: hypothetical protein ACLSVD_13895 [Eggerthellaceae bacterium]
MHAGAPSKTNGCPPRCSGGCGPSRSPRRGPRWAGPPRRTRASARPAGRGADGRGALEGIDGVAQVIAQLEGVFLPAASWEGQVLPARVRDYRPAMLTSCCPGDVVGRRSPRRRSGGRTAAPRPPLRPASWRSTRRTRLLRPQPTCPKTSVACLRGRPRREPSAPPGPEAGSGPSAEGLAGSRPTVESAVVDALGRGGGLFFRQIVMPCRRSRRAHRLGSRRRRCGRLRGVV